MKTEGSSYLHSPVQGLPRSLMELNDNKVVVISLMTLHAGLNRERRRELQVGAQLNPGSAHEVARKVSKTDWAVLTFYLSPQERWKNFWQIANVLQRGRNPIGMKAYVLAVDIQLLDAYDTAWRTAVVDTDALTEVCVEWPRISEALGRYLKLEEKPISLGAFMLWPRLLNDLHSWDQLEPQRRLQVAHAIFSLSSIGWTRWFVDEAIARCPALEAELGVVKVASSQPAEVAQASPENSCSSSDVDGNPTSADSAAERTFDHNSKWLSIGGRLTDLQRDWSERPSRDLLTALLAVSADAAELLKDLPEDVSPRQLLNQRQDALSARLAEAAASAQPPWLGSADLEAVALRWGAALDSAKDDALSLAALAADSKRALEDLDLAIEKMRAAQARVADRKQAVAALDEQMAQQLPAARRVELVNQQLAVRQEAIEAERQHADAMLPILAAASPRGEISDSAFSEIPAGPAHEVDGDVAETASESTSTTDSSQTVLYDVQASLDAVNGIIEQQEFQEAELPRATGAEAAAASPRERPQDYFQAAENTQESSAESSIPQVLASGKSTSEADVVAQDFSAEAGDQCRPIWTMLRLGKSALAYQFAYALESARPGLRVPPPPLLKAVALAASLTTSDGPLAMPLGEALAQIEAEWFEPGDTPSNWHTALNLLLVAATLRPLVLAPATGAAAIASYRHLDGRHSALLELVRKVGDIREPMTTGLSIGLTALRAAGDEASQKAHLAKLSKDAGDWLYERAPRKKVRYAPASQVWLLWLKPGEPIHDLVSPVVRGALNERSVIKKAIEDFSDYTVFAERLRDTDRRQLERRGPDIEAGALEHLWVATCEAVAIAREWLAATNLLSDSGDRLRVLVGRLQAAFDAHAAQASAELERIWESDDWGQVAAASHVLRSEVNAIAGMFKQCDAAPTPEPQPMEVLARDLLWVSGASLGTGWVVESDRADLLQSLESWSESPVDAAGAFDARIKLGDLVGAEMLLPHLSSDDDRTQEVIDKSRDHWAKDLQRGILLARRMSEVGLAFGYLSDTERAACESELSAVESNLRDTGRFHVDARIIQSVVSRIERQKAVRITEARRQFELERPNLSPEVAEQVEAPLARSDIHTFNELLQRVRQGADPWPERDLRRDALNEFHPTLQTNLLGQLAKLEAVDIDKLIRQGNSVGQLSFDLEGDQQARLEAEESYRVWATSFSRRNVSRDNLRKILEAVGVSVRGLEQDRSGAGWSLQTAPIDDRDICPVPHFGSRAQGRYRVIVPIERLTPDDLLQRIGENSQQTATIVLMLARSPARFWSELAKLSKERQRSFLLLDESMLLFLLAQRGSRLATWFSIALPFTYSEPYDASAGFVPPEMFYGRASELESVKAQGGCYFIYGGRQLGKTALLRRAERTFHNPAASQYAVWVDLLAQGIGERRPAADVWLSVQDKLRELKIADLDLPSINPAKPNSIDAFLAAIKAFLSARPGRRLLLLLDEADHFFEQDGRQESAYAETRRLKQLMDETERRFKVVFAGLHNVLRTASTSNQPLGHLNEAVRIGPLMDEREIRAAEELITRPIEAVGFEFEDRSLVMRVLAQTNYYPSLIQLYCTQLLRHVRESKLRRRDLVGPRFKIDEADIETVFAGRPLRDAIRSKFRLTLQLDDRYEVIANAIGLEALEPGFDHVIGIDWRTIRHDCTTSWWPEGFRTTSERDFLALLEEMVQLGVLSQAKTQDRFSLRNPNVLLLLGSKQEIEDTLQAEREPRIEFESTIFRPALGGRVDNAARNPLTYRQLDEVVQMRSSVSMVAASEAAGAGNLLVGLRDQPGMADSRLFVLLDRALDKRAFKQELDKEVKKRVVDGITVMFVPASVPWNQEWVAAARAKLSALKSTSSFVSVVFAADPLRLWELAGEEPDRTDWDGPWLSVLPWARGFVRKWLEELQFPADAVDRLHALTGFWGGLLEATARVKGGALEFAHDLDHMEKQIEDPAWKRQGLRRLTGGIVDAERVLVTLGALGNGVTERDLVDFGDLPPAVVARTLRWAEPLGLVSRQAGSMWALDSFFARVLEGARQ